jgi:hypothetical protein
MRKYFVALSFLIFACFTVFAQNLATLRVVNNSNKRIVDIYVSPTSSTRWGSSYTGSTIINPGESFDISVSSGYDFRVKLDYSQGENVIRNMPSTIKGNTYIIYAVDKVVADPNLETLRVINKTTKRIVDIYVSPTTSTRWGSSYTGESIVNPGESFDILVAPAYDFRIKIDFSQGDSALREMPSTNPGKLFELIIR